MSYLVDEAKLNRVFRLADDLAMELEHSPFRSMIENHAGLRYMRAALEDIRQDIKRPSQTGTMPIPSVPVRLEGAICGRMVICSDNSRLPCKLLPGHAKGCNPF